MTGIILRQNIKQYFNSKFPQEGEIVFASDTDEIGSLSEGILIWQDWNVGGDTQYAYRGSETVDIGVDGDRFIEVSDEIREYVKENGSWRELIFGVDQVWVNENVEPDFHNVDDFPYLGKYSYTMEQGYVCSGTYDIVTKEYLEANAGSSSLIRLDGSSEFIEGYVPSEDNEIVTLVHLMTGDVKFVVPETKGPDGSLWNNNGVLSIAEPPIGLVKYYTSVASETISFCNSGDNSSYSYSTDDGSTWTSVPTSTDGDENYTNIVVTAGHFIIRSNITPTPTFNYSSWTGINYIGTDWNDVNITKVEILQHGGRTNWMLIAGSNKVTEFVVTATDPSLVTHYTYAFYNSSITNFPSIDTSAGIHFDAAWNYYQGGVLPILNLDNGINFEDTWARSTMTTFPVQHLPSAINLASAWSNCKTLTSFPLINVPLVENFTASWRSCWAFTTFPVLLIPSATTLYVAWFDATGLTVCPANSMVVPVGTVTTSMCTGI